MHFNNETDIELFIENIHEKIKKNEKKTNINDVDIFLGKDYGFSLSGDHRVPQKNIAGIKEREKLAKAYKKKGIMDMAAVEWEECAKESIWNCLNGTFNISNRNIKTIIDYLNKSKGCWFKFSGNLILPSQSKLY
jgi:hypothetical protein